MQDKYYASVENTLWEFAEGEPGIESIGGDGGNHGLPGRSATREKVCDKIKQERVPLTRTPKRGGPKA